MALGMCVEFVVVLALLGNEITADKLASVVFTPKKLRVRYLEQSEFRTFVTRLALLASAA